MDCNTPFLIFFPFRSGELAAAAAAEEEEKVFRDKDRVSLFSIQHVMGQLTFTFISGKLSLQYGIQHKFCIMTQKHGKIIVLH